MRSATRLSSVLFAFAIVLGNFQSNLALAGGSHGHSGGGHHYNPPHGRPGHQHNSSCPGGGGGNNGGGDGNQQTQSTQEQQDSPPAGSAATRFTMRPIGYGDFDHVRKVFNLSTPGIVSATSNPLVRFISTKGFPSTPALVAQNYKYKVVESLDILGGVGVMGFFHEVGATATKLIPFVGVLPMIGYEGIVTRHLNSDEELNIKMGKFKIPEKAENLNTWRENDSLLYKTSGGVLFFAGAGVYGAGVAPGYLAQGEWSTYIQKISPTSALVKYTNNKLTSFGIPMGTLISALTLSDYDSKADGFSYIFDFTHAAANQAYEDFVKGDFTLAQTLAIQGGAGVHKDTSFDFVKDSDFGDVMQLWLGLPILANYSWKSSTAFETNATVYHNQNDSRVEANYGIYTKDSKGKAFDSHSFLTQTFYGVQYANKKADGTVTETGLVGKYIWNFEDDHTSDGDFKRAVESLNETLAIDATPYLNMPQTDDLRYVNMQIVADIPNQTSAFLTQLGAQPVQTQNALTDLALKISAAPLAKQCVHYANEAGPEYCVVQEQRRVEFYARKMTEALHEMYVNRKDSKPLVLAYAAFGKAMLQSPYTFQAFLKMVETQPLTLTWVVQGQSFPRAETTLISR